MGYPGIPTLSPADSLRIPVGSLGRPEESLGFQGPPGIQGGGTRGKSQLSGIFTGVLFKGSLGFFFQAQNVPKR